MSPNPILIVEDDEPLSIMLQSTLTHSGYDVVGARTGASAMDWVARQNFSVVLLDLTLPDMDGKEVLSAVRAKSETPVIILSARTSDKEKVYSLDHGANDYVTKPFNMAELEARVRVAMRSQKAAAPATSGTSRFAFDPVSRIVTLDGRKVRLSKKEAALFTVLLEARGEVVGHRDIIQALWSDADPDDLTNLRVLTWQIRRKIETDPTNPGILVAEAGIGYRLNIPG